MSCFAQVGYAVISFYSVDMIRSVFWKISVHVEPCEPVSVLK